MAFFANSIASIRNALVSNTRNISMRPALRLKEIRQTEQGNELIVEGVTVPSGREPYLVRHDDKSKCPLCATGLDVKHTDVLILSQFVRSDGCMLPKRVTGLCNLQQKRVSSLVTMAHKAGLMPNLSPSYSKKDPRRRYGWKRYNKYFDEKTITFKY